MNMKQPMTLEGKAQLEAELKNLLSVERPAAIRALEEARGHGDLSENADYDAAKERQGYIEGRINDVQVKLASADVVDTSRLKSDRIIFGATVKILDTDTDEEISYKIVGEDESDVRNGKLSVFSPLARALIGKKKGDLVEVKSPKGEKEYEIIGFKFV